MRNFVWTRKTIELTKRTTNRRTNGLVSWADVTKVPSVSSVSLFQLGSFSSVCEEEYQEVLLFTKYQLSYLENKLCMTPQREAEEEEERESWNVADSVWNTVSKTHVRHCYACAASKWEENVREEESIDCGTLNTNLSPQRGFHVSLNFMSQHFMQRNLCVKLGFFFKKFFLLLALYVYQLHRYRRQKDWDNK